MQVRLSEMKGALSWGQLALAKMPQSNLVVEGQIGMLISLCPLLIAAQNYQEAIQIASQSLYLAEQLRAPMSIALARAMLICCTANAGHTRSTIELVEADRGYSFRQSDNYTDLEMSAALFRLGNFEEGSSVLSAVIERSDQWGLGRYLDFKQRIEAFWGIGGLDGPTYATPLGAAPSGWLTEVPRALMRAYGTPREGKEAAVRARHFLNAIEICQGIEHDGTALHPWHRLFAQWAAGTAHLGRGEFADAAGVLEHAERVEADWLDIRVLVLGAALELSLSWQAPEGFSPARYEHLLRQVFSEAANSRYASTAGLARLLHRWHPTAAAYLALAPYPMLACAFATRSVMKVGQQNFVGELQLPPVYACDLMLRALDFDLQPDFTFVQGDAGGGRKKKKGLMGLSGSVPVWQLPVSAVKLAYGLMRHQKPEYQERARSVISAYGIRPLTTAFYPMHSVVDAVESCTTKLLDNHLTPRGFAAEMNALKS